MKILKKLFKRRKWTIFASYNHGYTSYLIYARLKSNGVLSFKTIRVGSWIHSFEKFDHSLVDIKKQFGIITNGDTEEKDRKFRDDLIESMRS